MHRHLAHIYLNIYVFNMQLNESMHGLVNAFRKLVYKVHYTLNVSNFRIKKFAPFTVPFTTHGTNKNN